MAGSASHTAYRGVERRPGGGVVRAVVWAVVVMVSIVLATVVLGVTVAGLNEQYASAGNPLQEKVIWLGNEPCGVAVTLKVPGCPAATVILVGLKFKAKPPALIWKLWLTGVAAE